jgi:arylsulfatase A
MMMPRQRTRTGTWALAILTTVILATVILGPASAGRLARAAGEADAKEGASRPNFVVFLTDDQGWGDLACYGHPTLKTPHLDQFASQGMRFTQCYAGSAFCSPSRSAILTGRTPYRNGVFTWLPERDPVHLRRSEITIARLLKEQGYATCHVGKWHLNGFFNSPEQPQPNDHGYDHWFATQNNAAPNHKDPVNFVRNGKPVGPLHGFSSILVVEEAIAWLWQRKNKGQPFFLTVWTHEPHLPIESDPKFMALYEGDDDLKQHHGNISQMDHAFGMLMRALDEQRLTDDTFVIYTADNGPEGRLDDRGMPIGRNKRTRGSTGGLRGRKRDVYEGGIRVPGIVRWPGHVTAGSTSREPIIGSDIFTTICDIVKIAPPSDRTIDGASILPALGGKPVSREVPLYWRCNIAQGPKTAMRIGDWKILADEGLTEFEMYNIETDPREQRNLVEAQPDKFREMRAALVQLNSQIEAEGPDWWKGYKRPGQR